MNQIEARPKRRRAWPTMWSAVLALPMAFVASRLFLYPADVQGDSMSPQIQDGERLLVTPLNHPHRGDIVVVREAVHNHYYVKRVIAVSGDHLRIEKGYVFINDKPVDEPYVAPGLRSTDSYPDTVIPDNSCFVLSDNRRIQDDSREFGAAKYAWIEGKVRGVYWPLKNRRIL